MIKVHSFIMNKWVAPEGNLRSVKNAVTGEIIAEVGSDNLDFGAMMNFARCEGGKALRAMTFHERAFLIKDIALYLNERKDQLYSLSFMTGATMADSQVDVDGGITTMFVYSSKGRREMPDSSVYVDGALEQLSRDGNFIGQHIMTPIQGVGVQINAFNFPVWGMLEKLAPCIIAGVPVIVKPATATSYVTEACVKMIIESGILPKGALQLISGNTGDLFDHLTCQDLVSFTGSAQTANMLRNHPIITEKSVRFVAEQDSLNASIMGEDVTPDSEEFAMMVKEVVREMTIKAGQKCTAIRRIIVPEDLSSPFIKALSDRLDGVKIGRPEDKNTRMGALVSLSQREDVWDKAGQLLSESELAYGSLEAPKIDGIDTASGAFISPIVLHCKNPDDATLVHSVEAFGPVATVMGYRDSQHAVELANKGEGSLVASVFTNSGEVASQLAMGSAAYHGRLYFANRETGRAGTGHGSPLPHMVHGGPGRAGGGEELGGVRAIKHYMQRTAIQGNPELLSAITGTWIKGSHQEMSDPHPFRIKFCDLNLGKSFHSKKRKVTLEDIEHFAKFTGDTFYAHMNEKAAAANPFFPGRVAHGYLLISFAAGLFVDPEPGPVLANTGLDNLRFLKPVEPETEISVELTVKEKTSRNDEYGEVRWTIFIIDSEGDHVAEYELLTMNEK